MFQASATEGLNIFLLAIATTAIGVLISYILLVILMGLVWNDTNLLWDQPAISVLQSTTAASNETKS